jgi:hypothetical protein
VPEDLVAGLMETAERDFRRGLTQEFDERWAARFGSLVIPAVPKNVGLKGSPVNMRRARKKQKKPAGLRLKAKRGPSSCFDFCFVD